MLAVCVLLLTGSVGCGSSDAHGQEDGKNSASHSPVGELLDDTDKQGRPYREVGEDGAPEVAIEVVPDPESGWDVRLTVHNFRFSAAGAKEQAVTGRGVALLFVDGSPVASLRTPEYHLTAGYVPHGTHHVTARLYADDDTVWAVDGEPVESTADITASEPESSGGVGGGMTTDGAVGRGGAISGGGAIGGAGATTGAAR